MVKSEMTKLVRDINKLLKAEDVEKVGVKCLC